MASRKTATVSAKKQSTTVVKKTNLDNDYNKHVKQFDNDFKQLPTKKKKLKSMENQLNLMSLKSMNTMTTDEINDYHKMKIDISELRKEIQKAEDLTDVSEFYLKTGELLMAYYDSVNETTVTPAGTAPASSSAPSKKKGRPKNKKNNISTNDTPPMWMFLGNKDKPAPITQENTTTPGINIPPVTTDINKTSVITVKQNAINKNAISLKAPLRRADIHDQYLAKTDTHHIEPTEYDNSDDFCSECGEYRELSETDAILICNKCGDELKAVMESNKPSYKDPPHENMYFAYKRINHFKEQLSHFQAKETTKIPDDVYDMIMVQLKKDRITNLANLTRKRVKDYLQKYTHLGYNKYYENINQIIYHLNGMQPLRMPPEVEEQLCNMFQKIQVPFELFCPRDRANFLSYSYVIHKFCQLLHYPEYLPYFTLLKSKEKLHQQDQLWKKICKNLGWNYYPSSH